MPPQTACQPHTNPLRLGAHRDGEKRGEDDDPRQVFEQLASAMDGLHYASQEEHRHGIGEGLRVVRTKRHMRGGLGCAIKAEQAAPDTSGPSTKTA